MFLFCLVFAMSLCASVYMCFVVTCWEKADLLALVCGVCCLSSPPGFACWVSFAPLFGFVCCAVLVFALSPCYILIYMFWEIKH